MAAYDLDTAQTWTLGGSTPQDEASIVKVDILEALLAQSKGQGLASAEQPVAQSMIEESDNDSATDLWDDAGAASGIGSFDTSAGLTNTTPSQCVECPGFPWPGWGAHHDDAIRSNHAATPLVQANNLLTSSGTPVRPRPHGERHLLRAMGRHGGSPSGVTVALKNGWLPLNAADTDWQINSVGWVSGGGRNYPLAVLTTGDPSEQYGIDTIDDLSGMVWSALG